MARCAATPTMIVSNTITGTIMICEAWLTAFVRSISP